MFVQRVSWRNNCVSLFELFCQRGDSIVCWQCDLNRTQESVFVCHKFVFTADKRHDEDEHTHHIILYHVVIMIIIAQFRLNLLNEWFLAILEKHIGWLKNKLKRYQRLKFCLDFRVHIKMSTYNFQQQSQIKIENINLSRCWFNWKQTRKIYSNLP